MSSVLFLLLLFYEAVKTPLYLAGACAPAPALMDKWLKSPDSPNLFVVVLIVTFLVAIVEVLVPRVSCIVLRRTPIVVGRKTTNPL